MTMVLGMGFGVYELIIIAVIFLIVLVGPILAVVLYFVYEGRSAHNNELVPCASCGAPLAQSVHACPTCGTETKKK